MCLKRDAIYCIVLESFALQLVRLTRGVDDFSQRPTAARKLDRSFTGPFLPDLFRVRYHCPWYLFFSSGVETICMVFFRKFVQLLALLSCPSDCELWFTINWISEKSTVNTCKMFTLRVNFPAASLPRILGHMVLDVFFGFAMLRTMTTSFLYHAVRDRECIQSYFVKIFSGFAVNQALSASAVHTSSILLKKTVRTLHFWNCFA